MRSWWDRTWFTPETPTNLGVCRVMFYGLLLYHFKGLDFSHWADVPRSLWSPIPLFRSFNIPGVGAVGVPLLSADVLWWMALAWRASLLLACVGLFTRTSAIIAAVLGLYLLGIQHSFGKVTHTDAVLIFSMMGLALSRCGDGFSIDRLIHRARHESHLDPIPESGEYRWPIRWVWLVLSICFFGAGIAKIYYPRPGREPLDWIFSDNLANLFISFQYMRAQPTDWSLHIAQHLWATQVLALGTVLLEILFPLVLFNHRVRWLLVPAAFVMQLGNGYLLGVFFSEFKIIYIFFINWVMVGNWLGRLVMPAGRYSVLYDGSCGICKRTMAVFRGIDLARRVEILDVLADWPKISSRYPHLDQMECLTNMHVISPDGKVTVGYDGYRSVSRVMPLFWPLIPLLYIPPVPQIGRRVYAWVARSRFSAGCVVPTNSLGSVTAPTPDEPAPTAV